MSAKVSVALKKTGRLFLHPMEATSGMATRGSTPGGVG